MDKVIITHPHKEFDHDHDVVELVRLEALLEHANRDIDIEVGALASGQSSWDKTSARGVQDAVAAWRLSLGHRDEDLGQFEVDGAWEARWQGLWHGEIKIVIKIEDSGSVYENVLTFPSKLSTCLVTVISRYPWGPICPKKCTGSTS